MIKVSCIKGNIELTVDGSVPLISAEMQCIIKALYDSFKERNEKDAEFFKACMLHDLEKGGPFMTIEQLREEAKATVGRLLDTLLDRMLDKMYDED